MAYKKLKLWFDKDLAVLLANKIIEVYPNFDSSRFVASISRSIEALELKDRIEVFADNLSLELTNNYKENIQILSAILGPENKEETGMFTNFYWLMPIAKYVEKYGLDDFATSMKIIEEITKRNTGEYTIRPFLQTNLEKTLSVMEKWSVSNNRHVRRLASEGVRPRLPWAKKLDVFIEDPRPILPILNQLKNDPSKYVQNSVANCLNDILKDNPTIGKEIINEWTKGVTTKECKWIIKHALRNFLKIDDSWAKQVIERLKK